MYIFTRMNDTDDIKIETHTLNAYSGQTDMIKQAIKGDKVVGFLQYAVYEDEPYIQLIKVDENYRRQGIATSLLKDLQHDFPRTSINTGMMTEEGKMLFSKVSKVKANPVYTRYKNRLEAIDKELAENQKKWDWFYENLDKDIYVMNQDEVQELNDRDQELKLEKWDLEKKISQINQEFTYIK